MVDSAPDATTIAAPVHFPMVDYFYNAPGKAPYPDIIIPKQESRWWKNREMRKMRKAKKRAKAEMELQKMKEDAARLAEQNANFMRELNLSWQSHSGATPPVNPSISAASVGGPLEYGLGRIELVISSPTAGFLLLCLLQSINLSYPFVPTETKLL